MTDNKNINAFEGLTSSQQLNLFRNLYYNEGHATERGIIANAINDILPEYHTQNAKIERLQKYNTDVAYKHYRDGIKEFAEKINKLLGRYAHLHKYADNARHSAEEYLDGTPMEMVSVWEVLSLKKWDMVDYETMNELQENIENIAKERLLSELEKDFHLLIKEMTESER